MKNLLFGIITTVMFSFVGNSQTFRENFLKGMTSDQVIEAFSKLSESDQKKLWLEKIDQLISLKLPNEHHNLIKEIRETIDKGIDEKSSSYFLNSVAKLAQITPLKDFGNMVETLGDYKYDGKFDDTRKVPETIIKGIESFDMFSKGSCSCRWCLFGTTTTSKNCNPTKSGCGIFWLQECDKCILCL